MIALGKPLGCCVHRCDELNPSPCLPLHLTHRHAPFSQCGWFHLLACHDVMSKSLSYPSRQGFQRQSLGLMPRWTEPLRRRISTLARSEEHTSELQSLMRIPYAVFRLTKKNQQDTS